MAKRNSKAVLNTKATLTKIRDVRMIVTSRMRELDMTAYRLAKLSGVTIQTVSNFVNGTSDSLRSDRLMKLLAALRLEIRPIESTDAHPDAQKRKGARK